MNIFISSTNNLPIYEQIVNQIKDNIIKHELAEGELLPSIRSLAKELQISVITTKHAYEQLESEGLLRSVPGKGFYVCAQNTDLLKEKQLAMFENRFLDIITECKNAKIPLSDIQEMIEVLYNSKER